MTALEPVFAAVAGMVAGEVLTGRMALGGGVILSGMLLAELGPQVRWNWGRRIRDSEAV